MINKMQLKNKKILLIQKRKNLITFNVNCIQNKLLDFVKMILNYYALNV